MRRPRNFQTDRYYHLVNRVVHRAHVLEGKSAEEVCREFGIDNNHLRQIKFRVEKAISLVEAELSDE